MIYRFCSGNFFGGRELKETILNWWDWGGSWTSQSSQKTFGNEVGERKACFLSRADRG